MRFQYFRLCTTVELVNSHFYLVVMLGSLKGFSVVQMVNLICLLKIQHYCLDVLLSWIRYLLTREGFISCSSALGILNMTIWLLNSKWGCYGSLSNTIHGTGLWMWVWLLLELFSPFCVWLCSLGLGFFFFLSTKPLKCCSSLDSVQVDLNWTVTFCFSQFPINPMWLELRFLATVRPYREIDILGLFL
jgi:hypothetical protein